MLIKTMPLLVLFLKLGYLLPSLVKPDNSTQKNQEMGANNAQDAHPAHDTL